jgi:hypothetical protein
VVLRLGSSPSTATIRVGGQGKAKTGQPNAIHRRHVNSVLEQTGAAVEEGNPSVVSFVIERSPHTCVFNLISSGPSASILSSSPALEAS